VRLLLQHLHLLLQLRVSILSGVLYLHHRQSILDHDSMICNVVLLDQGWQSTRRDDEEMRPRDDRIFGKVKQLTFFER
jgi:hypothetical protein